MRKPLFIVIPPPLLGHMGERLGGGLICLPQRVMVLILLATFVLGLAYRFLRDP